jgi:hypothetical protein
MWPIQAPATTMRPEVAFEVLLVAGQFLAETFLPAPPRAGRARGESQGLGALSRDRQHADHGVGAEPSRATYDDGATLSCIQSTVGNPAPTGAGWNAPAQVADAVFKALGKDPFYILTHPAGKEYVRTRMEDILQERNPTPP